MQQECRLNNLSCLYILCLFSIRNCIKIFEKSNYKKMLYYFLGNFFMLYLGTQWIQLVMTQTLLIYLMRSLNRPFIPIATTSFLVLGYLHYDRIMVNGTLSVERRLLLENGIQRSTNDAYMSICLLWSCCLRSLTIYIYRLYELCFLFSQYYCWYCSLYSIYLIYQFIRSLCKNGLQFQQSLSNPFQSYSLSDQLIRPKFSFAYFDTYQWEEHSLFTRHIVCQLISCCERFKYFLAFNFSQASMDAS
ncbi:unnamed protein product [Paramecium sonneborni]|uniref:Transmembrane protein n=1 Tax=Paramecium sonneborni TaxID=65129 RepID=A0A8S1R355_9CILI|nr:unnamed protein product [Paramecium sonneborni]